MSDFLAHIPYCGLAPLPAEIWSRWNVDPALIAVLAALMAWHAAWLRTHNGQRTPPDAHREIPGGPNLTTHSSRFTTHDSRFPIHNSRFTTHFYISGWAAIAVGLISPLCALGVALFSARVTQHMWLMLIAAPLLVLADASLRDHGKSAAKSPLFGPMTAAAQFGIALWAWHLPQLYDWTFRSDLAYWLMHITLTASAWLLWHALLHGRTENWLARVAAGFVTVVHMGLLGALITLAPRLLYQAHSLSAQSWGLSPLEDQQLGGLIMWVPACAVLLFGGLSVVYGALSTPGRNEAEGPTARASSRD